MSGMIGAILGSVFEGAGKGMVAMADNQIAQDNARIAADRKEELEKRLYAAKMMMDEQAAARAASRVAAITGAKVTEKVAGAATEFDDDGNPTAPNASTNERGKTTREQVRDLTAAGMVAEAAKLQGVANGEAVEKYHSDLVDARKEGIAQKDRAVATKAEVDRERINASLRKYVDAEGNPLPSPGIEIANINSYSKQIDANDKKLLAIQKAIFDGKLFGKEKDAAEAAAAALEADNLGLKAGREAAIARARQPASQKRSGAAAPTGKTSAAFLPSGANVDPLKAAQQYLNSLGK